MSGSTDLGRLIGPLQNRCAAPDPRRRGSAGSRRTSARGHVSQAPPSSTVSGRGERYAEGIPARRGPTLPSTDGTYVYNFSRASKDWGLSRFGDMAGAVRLNVRFIRTMNPDAVRVRREYSGRGQKINVASENGGKTAVHRTTGPHLLPWPLRSRRDSAGPGPRRPGGGPE